MKATVYSATFRILSATKPMGQWPNTLTLRGKGGEVFEALIGHAGDFDEEDIPEGVKWGCCFPNDIVGAFPELAARFILGEKASKTASSLYIEWKRRVIKFSLKDWGLQPLWFGASLYNPSPNIEPPKPETRYREFLLLYRAVRQAYPAFSLFQALRATEYRLHIRWGRGCESSMGAVYYWLWKEKTGSRRWTWGQFGKLLNDQLEKDMEGGCRESYYFAIL